MIPVHLLALVRGLAKQSGAVLVQRFRAFGGEVHLVAVRTVWHAHAYLLLSVLGSAILEPDLRCKMA